MRRFHLSLALFCVAAIVVGGAMFGCESAATLEIVPVLPSDPSTGQPYRLDELQERLGFDRFEFVFTPLETAVPVSPQKYKLSYGQDLEIKNLEEGLWRVEVSALFAAEEKLYGHSAPFEVRRARSGRVDLPIGESFAFNLMAWKAQEAANAFKDLEAAAGIAFEDERGRQLILVTGGRRGATGAAIADALLVDVGTFEVTFLDPMPSPRAGHRALLLNGGQNPLIALVGGDEGRPNVSIFDGQSRRFSEISLVKDCKGIASTDGAFMVRATLGGQVTGQLMIPGSRQCLVDAVTGKLGLLGVLYEPVPAAQVISAENPAGEVTLVAGEHVFAERALERESCRDTQEGALAAVWSDPVRPLENQRLWSLSHDPTGRFLLVGSAQDRLGWRLLDINSCEVRAVTEGLLGPGTNRTDSAFINLPRIRFDSGEFLPQAAALLTGGRGPGQQRLNEVLLFVDGDGPETAVQGGPVWLPLSNEHLLSPLRLQKGRAGHMAVAIGERALWILGGESSGAPEIFMLGRGKRLSNGETDSNQYRAALTLRSVRPQARRPGLRIATVVDTRSDAVPLKFALAEALPKVLRSKLLLDHVKPMPDISFLAISQDLGLLDDELYSAVKDHLFGAYCTYNPRYEYPGMLYVPQVTDDDRVFKAITGVLPKLGTGVTVAGCSLRQPLRAAFDGLANVDKAKKLEPVPKALRAAFAVGDVIPEKPGTIDIPPEIEDERARTDITLALLPMISDDCSQSLLEPRDPSVLDTDVLFGCYQKTYDSFFSLPPLPDERAGLLDSLAEAVNRPDNLSMVVLGNVAGDVSCKFAASQSDEQDPGKQSFVSLLYPRRLLATLGSLSEAGVRSSAAHICSTNFARWNFEETLEYFVVKEVARLNTLLACVPADYALGLDAGDEEPISDSGNAQDEQTDTDELAASLVSRCQFFLATTSKADSAEPGSTSHVLQTLLAPGKDFWLRPSSTTNLSCDASEKWAIEFFTPALWKASGEGIAEAIETGADNWKQALRTATQERNSVAILCVE